jgi:ferritin-like metal-binding protein YciE
MPTKTQDLHQFFVEELQDLYDAEKQLVKSLPPMAKAAANDALKSAIAEHLDVTRGHVQRLEECFAHLEQKAKAKPCKGMRGIIEEYSEVLEVDMEDAVMDAAIASGVRKIEHYEMVAYESLRGMAEQLQLNEVAELLGETLEEEEETDQRLTEICQSVVEEAASGGRSGVAAAKAGAGSEHGTRVLTDHDEIREWAEERDANPACVKGTGKRGGLGMLRLDFPGFTGEDTLQPVDWDDWFEEFDRDKLALLVQDTTASGETSNFNKLVSRQSVTGRQARPKTRAAG